MTMPAQVPSRVLVLHGPAPAECLCSSALLACRVIVLEDNDILHLARGSYNIYNLQRDDPSAKMASVSRVLSRLDMEVRSLGLNKQRMREMLPLN